MRVPGPPPPRPCVPEDGRNRTHLRAGVWAEGGRSTGRACVARASTDKHPHEKHETQLTPATIHKQPQEFASPPRPNRVASCALACSCGPAPSSSGPPPCPFTRHRRTTTETRPAMSSRRRPPHQRSPRRQPAAVRLTMAPPRPRRCAVHNTPALTRCLAMAGPRWSRRTRTRRAPATKRRVNELPLCKFPPPRPTPLLPRPPPSQHPSPPAP